VVILVDIAVVAIPALVSLELARRSLRGSRVPLAVWLIPGALGVDFLALLLSVRLGAEGRSRSAGAWIDRPVLSAVEAVGRTELVLFGIAALLAVEAGLSGLAGPDREASPPLRGDLAAVAGLLSGVALLVVGLGLVGFESSQGELSRAFVGVAALAALGAGVGAAGSLRRRTPRSYPLVSGLLGAVAVTLGLVAARVGAVAEAAGGAPAFGRWMQWYPSFGEMTVLAVAVAGIVGATGIALRVGRKPWKWGTLGDLMLFVFVAILFVAGLGATLQSVGRAVSFSGAATGPADATAQTASSLSPGTIRDWTGELDPRPLVPSPPPPTH